MRLQVCVLLQSGLGLYKIVRGRPLFIDVVDGVDKKPERGVWWWCRFGVKIKHFLNLEERHHLNPDWEKKMTESKCQALEEALDLFCFLSTGCDNPHGECSRDSAFLIYIALIHCCCSHLLTIMSCYCLLSSSLLGKGGRGRKKQQMDRCTCLIDEEKILSRWITGPKLLQ